MARPERAASPVGIALDIAGFLLFLVLLAAFALRHPSVQGDTVALVAGVHAGRDCLAGGTLHGCPDVVHFPLLQYIPGLGMNLAGLSDGQILRGLAALSTFAFLGSFAVCQRVLVRTERAELVPIAFLLVLAGPLLWYSNSTYGESLATFLTLLYTASALLRQRWYLLAGTFWLAGITKETALPFLVAIGLIAVLGRRSASIRAVREQLLGIGLGAVLVAGSTALFNVFRYDSVLNTLSLEPQYRVSSPGQRIEFFAGLWTSPNGGLVFFAPLVLLLLASSLVAGGRAWRRGKQGLGAAWPGFAVAAVLTLLAAGFASWFQPFGWYAWGPRLLVPWLPSLALLALSIYGRELAAGLRDCLAARWRTFTAAAVVFLLALPHLVAMTATSTLAAFFAPDASCPPTATIDAHPDIYYECMNHLMWERHPVLLTALSHVNSTWGVLLGASLAAAVLGLSAWAQRLSGRGRAGSIA